MNIDIIFQNIEFLIKMVLATSMGAIIGFERKSRNKEAGIRTHAIVCLASALMVICSTCCSSSCFRNWLFGSGTYFYKK